MPTRLRSGWFPAGVLALAIAGLGCGGKPGGSGSGLVAADGGTGTGADLQALATPEEGELYHGVFPAGTAPDPDSDISLSALDAYQDALGLKVAYVYFNDEWIDSRAFPAGTVKAVRDRGAVPFIRLMMRSQKVPLVTDPVYTLDRINAGEFDADLRRWAQAARQSGGPLVVEYGTEVNGDWNPWSAPYNGGLDVGPGKFKQAYRHIVTVMRSQGAANITWALHYNSQNFPGDEPRNVPRAYYPGDDVVDWVGISAYGSERSTDQRCPSFRSLVDASLAELRAATATKPLFIFEFASTLGNPACPQTPWVEAALGDLLGGRWPDLRGFSWWQQKFTDDPALGGETDYLVQSNPAVLSAFRGGLTADGPTKVLDRPRIR
jgi:glycosyl hydrolase family 26